MNCSFLHSHTLLFRHFFSTNQVPVGCPKNQKLPFALGPFKFLRRQREGKILAFHAAPDLPTLPEDNILRAPTPHQPQPAALYRLPDLPQQLSYARAYWQLSMSLAFAKLLINQTIPPLHSAHCFVQAHARDPLGPAGSP